MDEPLKVYYSYCERDGSFRELLAKHLAVLRRQRLIETYDRKILPGRDRMQEILLRLESADIILLLISVDYLASDHCYEVEMATALERHLAGEARAVPVLLRSSDWLNTPIRHLQALPSNAKPVSRWSAAEEAFEDIAIGVRDVSEELRRTRKRAGLAVNDIRCVQKRPATGRPILLETGAMPADSPYYISRGELQRAGEQLESTSPTISVQGYRQSGKSSFLTRLHIGALEKGDRSCYLNFQDLDESSFANPSQLLLELGRMMSDELEIPASPDDYWSSNRDPRLNMRSFVDKAILADSVAPVQLLFDEVDVVFDFPDCRRSLFPMLRAWHGRRATDAKGRWRRLRLVIAHATDPKLWIRNPNQSPFNVGLPITLEDFNLQQAQEVNRRHGKPLDENSEVPRLMKLLGGHPYLLRLALHTLLSRQWTLAKLERSATLEAGPFADHLRRYRNLIQAREDLKCSLKQILEDGTCRDEESFERLLAAGLIRGETPASVEMRCKLYRDYFRSRL